MRAVAMSEIATGTKRLKGRKHVGKESRSRGLEIDEQSQGLLGSGIEHAVMAYIAIWVKPGGGVLPFEDLDKRIHVQAGQSPVGREACERVADVKLFVKEPNISFDTDTAYLNGGIQRDSTPVVIVRMTRYRVNSTGEVGGP